MGSDNAAWRQSDQRKPNLLAGQDTRVTVIGAGLAGCEAAWQLSRRGIGVDLVEMKPHERSPAHTSDDFGELVCSNSLRGAALSTAPGLLKEELRRLGSLLIACADETAIPAGGARAVDRAAFSALVTRRIRERSNIRVYAQKADAIPRGSVIIATGPLTEGRLGTEIAAVIGSPLHFYDAAAPIIAFDSVDLSKAYFASRYDKGTPDYINCPMNQEEYAAFVAALASAEEAPVHGFEDAAVFEGCMPVEVMARRGPDTLRYGPLKPVGLAHPVTGARPWAVVQLRADNEAGTMYNMVGFQTHLKQGEQRRVFGMIPGLEQARFLRYGAMHRNSFINAPGVLDERYRVIGREELMFAGQITGVEGYIESTASGLCAGLHMARALLGLESLSFSTRTAVGALARHISGYEGRHFQPMNINFGLIDPLDRKIRDKRERYTAVANRALEEIDGLRDTVMEGVQP